FVIVYLHPSYTSPERVPVPSLQGAVPDLLLDPEDCFLPKRVLKVRAEVVQAERLPGLEFAPVVSHKMAASRKIRFVGNDRSEQQVHKKPHKPAALTHFPETATAFDTRNAPGTCRHDP